VFTPVSQIDPRICWKSQGNPVITVYSGDKNSGKLERCRFAVGLLAAAAMMLAGRVGITRCNCHEMTMKINQQFTQT
jgi:hypothetical protein